MTKNEAITEHLKHWDKFPVFVWKEGDELVTEVDGKVVRANTIWQLDSKLDGIAPPPRNLYFVDKPDYEQDGNNAQHCMCPSCKDGIIHFSDCAVHDAPALPRGECDCGAVPNARGNRLASTGNEKEEKHDN